MNIAYSLFQYDQLQIAKYCKEETMKQEINFVFSEAVYGRCSVKKSFPGISQNSQENTSVRVSFLINLQAWGLQLCFPVNFAKFLRTPSIEHLWRLLLSYLTLVSDIFLNLL